jgi:hypothetical protein
MVSALYLLWLHVIKSGEGRDDLFSALYTRWVKSVLHMHGVSLSIQIREGAGAGHLRFRLLSQGGRVRGMLCGEVVHKVVASKYKVKADERCLATSCAALYPSSQAARSNHAMLTNA